MLAQEILQKNKVFAVIGVSPDSQKYSYRIFKRLIANGYETYGISPLYDTIDQIKIYPDLASVPTQIEVAVFVVNPKLGADYLKQCQKANVQYLWMQPGTYDEAFLQELDQSQIPYVLDCVLQRTPEK